MIYKFDLQHHKWVGTDKVGRDCWVSPEGEIYNCTAHDLYAEYIVEYLFNEDTEMASDILISKHWVKFTTSCMATYYKHDGMYDHLTDIQKQIYDDCFNFY